VKKIVTEFMTTYSGLSVYFAVTRLTGIVILSGAKNLDAGRDSSLRSE
jgi:hypothetical protein